jgi:hypothetical protein
VSDGLAAPDWSTVEAAGDVTLAVAWRSGAKMKLGRLAISNNVAGDLRSVAIEWRDSLSGQQAAVWTPDADIADDVYLVTPAESAGTHPVLAASLQQHGTFLAALRNAAALPLLSAQELPAPELACYAVVVGDDPETRAVFIRRMNPRRGLRQGKRFTVYRDALMRVDDPILAFDEWFDLILVGDQLVVLSQTAFMSLFRDNAALAAQVPDWVGQLAGHLPLAAGGGDLLAELAQRNTRIRTRLESIVRRGHLADVDIDQIVEAMEAVGLEVDEYIEDDALVIEAGTAATLLHFLNEDFFLGGLSDAAFRADRKTAT